MSLTETIFAQALVLSGGLEPQQEAMLKLLCQTTASGLTARLRSGLTPEDCKADFVAAASLMSLAAMAQSNGGDNVAASCLRYQAELIITPYLKDHFCFREI